MMRFLCPHCRHTLEVVKPTHALLCPACEQWCRIPVPDEFTLEKEEVREVLPSGGGPFRPATSAPVEGDCRQLLGTQEAPPPPPADAVTDRPPDHLPVRLGDEEEFEDVEMEIIEDGTERRPRRRRRRRRPRSSGGASFDLDFVSLPLILLIVLAPGALMLTGVAFLIHPAAGMGCLLMMGGGIWFTLIAAEDGLLQVVLVMFVPFYAFYYAINNWDRVALPFVLQLIGGLVFSVSMIAAGHRAAGHGPFSSRPPARLLRV